MAYQDLQGKQIAILGLGIENYALIKYLNDREVDCRLTICDSRDQKALAEKYGGLKEYKNIKWRLGAGYDSRLEKFDVVSRSPGYPLFSKKLKRLGERTNLTSPINLFFDWCPSNKIIGVTGTKGKGTTASLIHHVLKTAKLRSHLGGNIGVAPHGFLDSVKKTDWVVLELSSFQLEDILYSPHIAVITNFFQEHLAPADPQNPNYHKNLQSYWSAKLNLAKWQTKRDYLVVNQVLKHKIQKLRPAGKLICFSQSDYLSRLPGEHNKANVAAAAEACKLAGVPLPLIEKGIANFPGLEHRLEMAAKLKEVAYYNDSFATTPESTIIALEAFNKPIILLAGGADKGADFRQLAKIIAKKRIKNLLLLEGKATPRLKRAVLKAGYPADKLKEFSKFALAVAAAKKLAKSGEIVLLSPACASFGMFKNYKERGEQFKHLVKIKVK